MHWWWIRAFSSAYGSTETTLGGVGRWPFGLRATTVPPSPCFERRSCSPISVPRQAQALLAALRILLDRHHGLREVVHRLREVRAGLGEDSGRAAVDRDRDHPVGRHLDLHGDLEGSFDLALAQPDLRVRPVQDVPDPRRREREELERLHREAHVLEGRHVEAAQDEQLVRPVERREHRAVEERRGVDDDCVVALACNLEQSGDLRLGDELGVLRAQRRREDVEPARMLRRVAGELLHVEFSGCHDEVIDRLLGLDAHHDRGIPELQVESSSSVLRPCWASAAARFDAVTVLPVPPFGENTVITRPAWTRETTGVWRLACAALRIAKTTLSINCGRTSTSAMSAVSASSSSSFAVLEATTMIGLRVCSRMAATSVPGKLSDRVPCRMQLRCPPARTPAAWAT